MSPDERPPEIRRDPSKNTWVLMSSVRGKRSNDYLGSKVGSPKDCPFCPGNEHMTTPESYAIREGRSKKDRPGWKVRCFPNMFPAIGGGGKGEGGLPIDNGIFESVRSHGYHEVVVDSNDHDATMAIFPLSQVRRILKTYIVRSKTMAADPMIECVLVIKNHGEDAGASMEHPHSQILATPMVPSRIRDELDFFDANGKMEEGCVLDHIIGKEVREGSRIISESEHYIVWSPFWARFPYECWIVPKEHEPHFHNIGGVKVKDLAGVLRSTLFKIAYFLENPAYNFYIHSAPCDGRDHENFHWHLEILPRITKTAGFEEASGFYINPVPPEEAAEILRRPLVPGK